jgi:hypothetical protein
MPRWGALALTEPVQAFDHVRVFGGVRADLFRGWMVGQVEPEVRWAEGAVGPLRRVYAVTATLELVYDTATLAAPRRTSQPPSTPDAPIP